MSRQDSIVGRLLTGECSGDLNTRAANAIRQLQRERDEAWEEAALLAGARDKEMELRRDAYLAKGKAERERDEAKRLLVDENNDKLTAIAQRDEREEAARMLWEKMTFIGTPTEHARFPDYEEITQQYPWLAHKNGPASGQ